MFNAKTTICGPTKSGKTALIDCIEDKAFNKNSQSTIGATFTRKEENGVKFELWDTAGQTRFQSLAPMYLKDAVVVIYTVDLTQDLASQRTYLKETYKDTSEDSLIYLLGMKVDDEANRKISPTDLQSLAAELGTTQTFKCSAKTGQGVKELMGAMAKAVKTKLGSAQSQAKASPEESLRGPTQTTSEDMDQSFETKHESTKFAQPTESDALIPKPKKSCWAMLCCSWGTSSTAQEEIVFRNSVVESDVTYTKLSPD